LKTARSVNPHGRTARETHTDLILVRQVKIGGVSNYGVKHASSPPVPNRYPCFRWTEYALLDDSVEAAISRSLCDHTLGTTART
jgi:hypothetical protein